MQTVTQSQLGQCLAFPVEVRALTLNRIVEGCTGKWRTNSLAGCSGGVPGRGLDTLIIDSVDSLPLWRGRVHGGRADAERADELRERRVVCGAVEGVCCQLCCVLICTVTCCDGWKDLS